MKPRSPHTSFHKGTPLHVVLRSGRIFDRDKFVEKRERFIVLEKAGKILISDIRSASKWTPQ